MSRAGDDEPEMQQHHYTKMWSPLTTSLAKYLNRTLPESEKTGSAAKHYGPYTSVPLLGGAKMIGAQCGCMIFIPILTLLVFMADVALAIVAGLDMVERGSQTPYVQFSLSIAIAVLYMALCVMALTQYFWERVLDFKYHNVWGLFVLSVLAWINFGVWASWISRFHGSADGVDTTATVPFIAWVAANALGVAGFMVRFAILAIAIALRYTYDRTVEIQALVVHNVSGGSSIRELLSNKRFPPAIRRRTPMVSQAPLDAETTIAHQHPMWTETNFGMQQQQQQQQHYQYGDSTPPFAIGGARHHRSGPPMAFRR